jgi:outer membrane receptor protein involved in Fe transport
MTTASLKATVGKGFRNPTTKEMYLYGMANHDSLRAERLWNYELAWSHHLGRLNYGANIYYIKADNMIMSTATAQGNKNMNTG